MSPSSNVNENKFEKDDFAQVLDLVDSQKLRSPTVSLKYRALMIKLDGLK